MEEALAEYGGLRVVEALAGTDAARQMRLTGFPDDPVYSAHAYFELVGRGADHALGDLQGAPDDRDLAYTKGALVFDMLSREMGRTTFQQTMRAIVRRHRFQRVTWRQFLDEVAKGAGKNLDWFTAQWFDRPGAPAFTLAWTQAGDTLRGQVTQPEPAYRVTLPLGIWGGTATKPVRRTVAVSGATTPFALAVPFRVDSVVVDPDYEVLRWTAAFRAAADSAKATPRPGP
jgi:hypothetical protein